MSMRDWQMVIEQAWAEREALSPGHHSAELRQTIDACLAALEEARLRVAEPTPSGWQVNAWLKQAILLHFRITPNAAMSDGLSQFYDKVGLRFQSGDDPSKTGARVVPPAVVRQGAHIGSDVVLMPSYVNIGAYVGQGSMIDTWATVGSCAQIGARVHISGGAGIGGVLEPLQANPTIIEDNCFIGARSEIVEGVIVEEGAVISMGVYISQSTRIYDRETGEVHYGRVPAGAVVVPGSLPSKDGSHSLYAAIIVKKVDKQTREKVGINALLRSVSE